MLKLLRKSEVVVERREHSATHSHLKISEAVRYFYAHRSTTAYIHILSLGEMDAPY